MGTLRQSLRLGRLGDQRHLLHSQKHRRLRLTDSVAKCYRPSISRKGPGIDGVKKLPVPLLGKVRTENLLLLFTLLSVVLGTVIGLSMNPLVSGSAHLSKRQLIYLKFAGEMFIRMLQMLIVPLVVASNISAIASLNAKAARLLTAMSIAYYAATTVSAVTLGLVLVTIFEPGSRHRNSTVSSPNKLPNYSVVDVTNFFFAIVHYIHSSLFQSIFDLLRNMIPDNMFVATFQKSRTVVRKLIETVETNLTLNNSSSADFTEEIETNVGTPGTNILGLITFSILFGFAVHSLGPDAVVLADMFHAIRRVIVYLVSIVIWFSPVGIMCLIASELAGTKDLAGSIRTLSLYVATVMAGLFIHGCIVLPALLYLITKRNPLKYAYNMMQALMCALGTASSTATLPCTVRCLESGNQIDPRVTRFMLPLGTSINMDGTALFQAIAAVYISQLNGNTLEIHELVLAGMTAVLASMAASSMPSAGMITIVMVLTAVGLPADGFLFLYPVDWFLDRFRTMVNVFSNSVGAAVVSSLCEESLLREVGAMPIDDNLNDEFTANDYREAQLLDYEAALGRRQVKHSPIIPLSANIRSQLHNGAQPFVNGPAFTMVKQLDSLPTTATSNSPIILQSSQQLSEDSADDRDGLEYETRICVDETIYIQF